MKIAFTTAGTTMMDQIDHRFGRCIRFLVYNTDDKSFIVIENAHASDAQGAGLRAVEAIAKAGATALVTGECGPKAMQGLKAAGIKAYAAPATSLASSLVSFLAGSLKEIASA